MKPTLPIVLLASLALSGCADNSPGGILVHARHQHFEQLNKASKAINDQLKEKAPDLATIRADAAEIADLAPQLKSWFPAGSGPKDVKRTDAKAEIWTQPAEFDKAATRLADAAAALTTAAGAGNLAAIAASAKTVGAACKGCHERFKTD